MVRNARIFKQETRSFLHIRQGKINQEATCERSSPRNVTLLGDSQHGIDIIAIDAHNPRRRMWLIEISRGREMGAGLVKQMDKRKYAGYQSQMCKELGMVVLKPPVGELSRGRSPSCPPRIAVASEMRPYQLTSVRMLSSEMRSCLRLQIVKRLKNL